VPAAMVAQAVAMVAVLVAAAQGDKMKAEG
jgi:hypothetical protein